MTHDGITFQLTLIEDPWTEDVDFTVDEDTVTILAEMSHKHSTVDIRVGNPPQGEPAEVFSHVAAMFDFLADACRTAAHRKVDES